MSKASYGVRNLLRGFAVQAVPHTVMSSSTICGYPSWRSNRRQAARSECLLGFQCSALAALARNARLPRNARLAMLGSQRSARNVIPNAQLAMLSSHVTVPGPTEARIALPRLEVLGSKRSGSQRSARVALLRLKVSGSRIVIYLNLFASSVIMSRVRGNPSSRASDRLLCENRGSKISHVRTGSWVARLATSDLSKTAIKTHLI